MFGQWIKENRLQRGWTQKVMADESGIPQTTISGWETGKVEDLKMSRLKKLADVFSVRMCEIPLNSLFDYDNEDQEKDHYSNFIGKELDIKEKAIS